MQNMKGFFKLVNFIMMGIDFHKYEKTFVSEQGNQSHFEKKKLHLTQHFQVLQHCKIT